jgi:hypothetical protein
MKEKARKQNETDQLWERLRAETRRLQGEREREEIARGPRLVAVSDGSTVRFGVVRADNTVSQYQIAVSPNENERRGAAGTKRWQ